MNVASLNLRQEKDIGTGTERFNRQLHPDERKWAKNNAQKFAEYYKDKAGDAISVADAENLLLAGGYRLVDSAAKNAPGADSVATEYISRNSGALFSATDAERRDYGEYGNVNGAPTPEQRALNTSHTPNTQSLSWAVGAGLYYGIGGELELGFSGLAPTDGKLTLGVGLGGHGWVKGASSALKADFASSGRDAAPGDYRIGSSMGLSAQIGSGVIEGSISGGGWSNVAGKQPAVGGYLQSKAGIGFTPSYGFGLEGKANVFEFFYKRR